MTLYSFRSCKVSPPSEFLNVIATQMTGQMTLNIGSSYKVSPPEWILKYARNPDESVNDFEHCKQM